MSALSTDNEKLAAMEWCQVWEPGLPLSPGTLEQDDQQQLLWGFPAILWGIPAVVEEVIQNIKHWRRRARCRL